MNLLCRLTGFLIKLFNYQMALSRGARIDPHAFIARGGPVNIGEGSILRAGTMLLPYGGSIAIGSKKSLNQYMAGRIGNDVMMPFALCSQPTIASTSHSMFKLITFICW